MRRNRLGRAAVAMIAGGAAAMGVLVPVGATAVGTSTTAAAQPLEPPTTAGSSGPGSTGPATRTGDDAPTTWLCNPDMPDDPCDLPFDTTDLRTGQTDNGVSDHGGDQPVDCFYVYPTITDVAAFNAGDEVWPVLESIASFQAARFSSQCRVFAPVYDQVTLWGLMPGMLADHGLMDRAYDSLLSAWNDYLEHDNDGRGVIFIGHSQGTMMLRKLIREHVDPDPELRDRLVSAFLIGGNVETARGSTVGGDFQNVPLCTEQGQDGCVIAYSTVEGDPLISMFGNSAIDVLSFGMELPMGPQYQVACTDPAVLAGDYEPVGLTIPSRPFAGGIISILMQYTAFPQPLPTSDSTWTTSRQRAVGECVEKNGYDLYQFHLTDPGEPPFSEVPFMGTHLLDMNLGLQRLVSIAAQQSSTWLADHP